MTHHELNRNGLGSADTSVSPTLTSRDCWVAVDTQKKALIRLFTCYKQANDLRGHFAQRSRMADLRQSVLKPEKDGKDLNILCFVRFPPARLTNTERNAAHSSTKLHESPVQGLGFGVWGSNSQNPSALTRLYLEFYKSQTQTPEARSPTSSDTQWRNVAEDSEA